MTLRITMTSGKVYELEGRYGKPSLVSRLFGSQYTNFYDEDGLLVLRAHSDNIYSMIDVKSVKELNAHV